MKAPLFWQSYPPTMMAKLLTPFSYITQYITQQRLSKPSWRSPVPIICCGNLTVGGTGKTTVALALGKYFEEQGYKIAFLTRGYKRKKKSMDPVLVNISTHTVYHVGDEALLLAQLAPTWIAVNRAASAVAAIQNGANLLIMDDGFQNPTLYQDMPLLVIDGATGFGNNKALPAGPLREKITTGLSRAKACIFIGQDKTHLRQKLPKELLVLQAGLEMDTQIEQFRNQSVIAFAGIGRPDKFFQTLQDNDLNLIKKRAFPDHHFYHVTELDKLLDLKRKYQVPLVTTPKDYVRLPLALRGEIIPLGVHLKWQNPDSLQNLHILLDSILAQGVEE